jgi:hypothetical protein
MVDDSIEVLHSENYLKYVLTCADGLFFLLAGPADEQPPDANPDKTENLRVDLGGKNRIRRFGCKVETVRRLFGYQYLQLLRTNFSRQRSPATAAPEFRRKISTENTYWKIV